jgi:hypothetical protein
MENHFHAGRFPKGTSGNPAGRPAGSRHKATFVFDQLRDNEGRQLLSKLLELPHRGNLPALRRFLDRFYPERKDPAFPMALPPLESTHVLLPYFREVSGAAAAGEITPAQGESLIHIAMSHARVIELAALARLERFCAPKPGHPCTQETNLLSPFVRREMAGPHDGAHFRPSSIPADSQPMLSRSRNFL